VAAPRRPRVCARVNSADGHVRAGLLHGVACPRRRPVTGSRRPESRGLRRHRRHGPDHYRARWTQLGVTPAVYAAVSTSIAGTMTASSLLFRALVSRIGVEKLQRVGVSISSSSSAQPYPRSLAYWARPPRWPWQPAASSPASSFCAPHPNAANKEQGDAGSPVPPLPRLNRPGFSGLRTRRGGSGRTEIRHRCSSCVAFGSAASSH
jgi:hypothetical protein